MDYGIGNGDVDMSLNKEGIPVWMISEGDHIDAFEENTKEKGKTKVFSISAGKTEYARHPLLEEAIHYHSREQEDLYPVDGYTRIMGQPNEG